MHKKTGHFSTPVWYELPTPRHEGRVSGFGQIGEACGAIFTGLLYDDNSTIQIYMHIDGDWPPVNDEQVKSFLAETINGLINTFRSRLKRLSGN